MKKLLISILILIQAIVGFDANAAVEFASSTLYADAGKVAYWKLENVNDDGSTYNLTNVNSVPFVAAKYNNGSSHNGTTNSRYLYNANSAFNFTGAFTVTGWVNFTATSSNMAVLMNKLATNAVGELYHLRVGSSGKFEFVTWASSGGFLTISGTTNIATSTWYNFAIVTASTSDRRIFINGAKENSSTSLRAGDTTSKNGIAIGAYDYGLGVVNYLNGTVDDVVVFNRALSDTEVANLYNESGGAPARRRLLISN